MTMRWPLRWGQWRPQPPRLLTRVVFGVVLVAAPALADAPADQYEQFDRDALTIKDVFTRLEWERRPGTTKGIFGAAQLYCEARGMRLPSVKELFTIVDEEPHDEYEFGEVVSKMIDASAFPDTPVDAVYWSITASATPGEMLGVSFRDGMLGSLPKGGQAYTRCVR